MAESAPTIFGDESPEEFKRRRAYAQLLMQMGMQPQEPERSWTQGAARAVQQALGGYLDYKTTQDERTARTADNAAILAALTGKAPAAQQPQQQSFSPARYSDAGNMDNPVARTILAEAGNQGPAGQQAVAAVIANRAKQAGMTPEQVVMANNGKTFQFEPWGTQAGRTRMASYAPNKVQEALAVTNPVLQGQVPDPTGGATHFYAPKAQRAFGRAPPRWDNGTGVDFGDHRFFKLGYGGGQTVTGGGQPVTGGQQMAQASSGMVQPNPSSEALIRALQGRNASPAIQALGTKVLTDQFSRENKTNVEGDEAVTRNYKGDVLKREKISSPTELQKNFNAIQQNPNLRQYEKELKGQDPATAAALERAKTSAEGQAKQSINLPGVENAAKLIYDTVDKIDKHPGLPASTGWGGVFPSMPGGKAKDFDVLVEQAKGQTFLQAYEALRGAGQISEVEGAKATNALARLNQAQSEKAFREALQDFKGAVKDLTATAYKKSGVAQPKSPADALKQKYGLD